MKHFLSYVRGWRGIALITYMWLVLMAWVIVYVDVSSKAYFVSLAEIIFFALLYICPKLLKRAENLSIKPDSELLIRERKRTFFLKSWIASFGIFLTMYIIFYPGGFSPDSVNQYVQAIGIEKYNDWHPVIHTLFSFTLPLKLSGGWLGSIVLFQIVITSLSLAYMSLTLAEFGSRKYSALFLAYIIINPATLGIVMYPWKDVAFAVSAMMSTTFAVRIYFSGYKYFSPVNMLWFILFTSSATLFRHNAVLFTFPLLLVVLFYAGRKQKVIIVAGCCIFVAIVRFIIYPYLGVQKPGNRIVETTCTPMTIIANAVSEASEKIDGDIIDFLYKVATEEKWKNNYITGSFNSVKFKGISTDIIEEAGYAKILGMTLRCIKEAPRESLRGFAALTDMVYGISGHVDWGINPGVISNDYGIENKGIRPLQTVFNFYSKASRALLKHLFCHIGMLILAVIIFILAKADFRTLCFSIPILAYDFGTMLFLGGNDFRFFYVSYLVFPLIILVLLREKCEAQS